MLHLAVFIGMVGVWLPRLGRAQTGADSTADTVHVGGLRNPTTATVLGAIIPGAGLMYAGAWGRGAVTYVGTVGSIGTGLIVYTMDSCGIDLSFTSTCKPHSVWQHQVLGAGVVAVGAYLWVRGAVDARHMVERNNADRIAGARAARAVWEPTIAGPSAPGEPWRVGLHATW